MAYLAGTSIIAMSTEERIDSRMFNSIIHKIEEVKSMGDIFLLKRRILFSPSEELLMQLDFVYRQDEDDYVFSDVNLFRYFITEMTNRSKLK